MQLPSGVLFNVMTPPRTKHPSTMALGSDLDTTRGLDGPRNHRQRGTAAAAPRSSQGQRQSHDFPGLDTQPEASDDAACAAEGFRITLPANTIETPSKGGAPSNGGGPQALLARGVVGAVWLAPPARLASREGGGRRALRARLPRPHQAAFSTDVRLHAPAATGATSSSPSPRK